MLLKFSNDTMINILVIHILDTFFFSFMKLILIARLEKEMEEWNLEQKAPF